MLTYRGTVYPWHCDHIGHMNVMWYVGKFDEGTWHLMNAIGATPAYLRENRRGMAAVEQHIRYLREVMAGSIVSVHTTVREVHPKRVVFEHVMHDDGTGEIAARTLLTGVHMDTVLRKSCPMPEAIIEAATALIDRE